jgi:hypothetical protein
MQTIEVNKIFIENILFFEKDSFLSKNFKITPVIKNYNGLTCDSALYDIVISVIGAITYDALKNLAIWLKNSYKLSNIENMKINNAIDIEIENIEVDELIEEIRKNLKKAP